MKIALVRRRFSNVGGGELYLQRLMQGLLQCGHEVHLLAESWSEPVPGVIYHPIAASGRRRDRALVFARGVEAISSTLRVDCFFSLERTTKQDIYRAGDGVHEVWLERKREFAPFWKRPFGSLGAHNRNILALEKLTFDPSRTRYVIANSAMVRNEILARFPFPADRIRVIPNGVDLDRFSRVDQSSARARFGFDEADFVLLFVGSGWERKGLRFTVNLLNDLRTRRHLFPAPFARVKLVVVGKGRRPLVSDSDIHYAGTLPDVEWAYAAANLLAFLPVYEPAANVVSEAIASGLPVLTTAMNGASEQIVEGVNGAVIADPRDRDRVCAEAFSWIRPRRPFSETIPELSMEANVQSSLEIINLAARERGQRL